MHPQHSPHLKARTENVRTYDSIRLSHCALNSQSHRAEIINIAEVERAAFAREPEGLGLAITAIEALTGGRGSLKFGYTAAEEVRRLPMAYTRLANALTAVLCDPQFELNEGELWRLMFSHAGICHLFAASTLDGPEPAMMALLPGGLVEAATAPRSKVAAYLSILSLDARIEIDLDALFALPGDLVLTTYLSLISQSPVRTLLGEARREALLEMAGQIAGLELPVRMRTITLISKAWMDCSYAAGPRKHHPKIVLNEILHRLCEELKFTDLPPPPQRPAGSKPVMVVAAEIMHSRHVQYRYFGQYLRQLRTRFRLVLFTEIVEVDDLVRALFDEVVAFKREPNGSHLQEIYQAFRKFAPDAVFWLSIGMRHWGPLFANLRLAPMQFTAIGHSASTFCPPIDYYLIEAGYVSDPALFGEKVLLLPDESLRFERPADFLPASVAARSPRTTLKIAVPSNLLKLNPRFLTLLGRIEAEANRPVTYHFFPNAAGGRIEAFRTGVARRLKSAVIHPTLKANAYQGLLRDCDLILSPFPFGGLHSVIDALRGGVPVMAMERPEPHGMTDVMLLRRLKFPAWTMARTEDEYVAGALRLIQDDAVRAELSRQALALDIDKLMFGDATTPLGTDVSDLVWKTFSNHRAVMASPLHALTLADVEAMASGTRKAE